MSDEKLTTEVPAEVPAPAKKPANGKWAQRRAEEAAGLRLNHFAIVAELLHEQGYDVKWTVVREWIRGAPVPSEVSKPLALILKHLPDHVRAAEAKLAQRPEIQNEVVQAIVARPRNTGRWLTNRAQQEATGRLPVHYELRLLPMAREELTAMARVLRITPGDLCSAILEETWHAIRRRSVEAQDALRAQRRTSTQKRAETRARRKAERLAGAAQGVAGAETQGPVEGGGGNRDT